MEWITGLYLKLRERARAQTMTEYALILAAIAIVVYATYQTMGGDITTLVGKVDTALTGAT
jgi:Flp pilus assembly pilin Flp